MPRTIKFELKAYACDDEGRIASKPEVTEIEVRDVAAARNKAGRLAKKIKGPVDLAYAYEPTEPGQDWMDRYLTTANPDSYTASGFSFERLD